MKNTILNILEYINPSRFFGPIFMKELIISSRRRRIYLLRFAYILVLASFIFSLFTDISDQNSKIFIVSQMAQIGIHVTTTIVWFQFIAVQFLAMIMLSTAISDEIYNKTLGVLMTTPITNFQIVFGKLMSKLLQLLLIISLSFPVLAIVRVFGGVPWDYVFASICITLTSSIFAGSLSLFYSINNRSSQLALSKTISTCFLIYTVPFIAYLILNNFGKNYISVFIPKLGLFLLNPFIQMQAISSTMRTPLIPVGTGSWILHCIIMMVLSLIVLLISGFRVRKVGLLQITGLAGLLLTRKERKIADKKKQLVYSSDLIMGKIREINWPPVIWRELANPLIKSNLFTFIFSIMMAASFIITAYSLCIYYEVLDEEITQVVFVLVYFFIAMLRTSTFASTSITIEKEARTLPILLITSLSSKEIVFGKIIGSCLRAWPYWSLLAAHLIVFILLGMIKAAVLIPMTVLVISSALYISSIGVMFSSICKRSSTASTWNMIIFMLLVIPVCCIPFLYFGSPMFAAASILGVWGGFMEMFHSFDYSPNASLSIIKIIMVSHFSFIIYSIIYLILAYIAHRLSINHLRRRILD